MRLRLFSVAILAYFAWSTAACGARQTPMPADVVDSHEELLAHMAARSEEVHSARASAVMDYFGRAGRVRVRQAIVVHRPDRLRLETLSPFDSTLSVVTANQRELAFYDLSNETLQTGAPTADNLARLIPLRFTPGDIVSVLLGSPPLDRMNDEFGIWKLSWDSRRGAWKMYVPAADGHQLEIYVRHGSWVLAGAREVARNGEVLWEVRTADFIRVQSEGVEMEVPTRIRFLMKRENLDVSLTVSNYTLNPELEDWLFELDLPELTPIPMDAPLLEGGY